MKKTEYVSDDILIEAMQLIVSAFELQVKYAGEIAVSAPDGTSRLSKLLNSSFFYGYVMGLTNRIAIYKFEDIIEAENRGKNVQQLIRSVIANYYFTDSEPDWDVVLAWEAQAIAYVTAQNPDYENGMETGISLGNAILSGVNNPSTLLGTELFRQ